MTTITIERAPAGNELSELSSLLLLSFVGALLSTAVTGFLFGIGNNTFHLPILLSLFDEPQFAQDAFMQSMRYFASGLWLALRGVGAWVDPYWLMFTLLIVSRTISVAAFLLCARLIGVDDRRAQLLFVFLLCVANFLRNTSFAGGGGLFVNFFSHSEVANGVSLLIVYLLLRERFGAALTLNGVVFFINAFYAVWNIVPIAFVILYHALQSRRTARELIQDAAPGAAVALLFAAPVLWTIVSNPDFGKPLAFDYRDYLRFFWPYHFIFGENDLAARLTLIELTALGFLSLAALGKMRGFALVLAGYATVYMLGVAAPSFTASPTILNLHLLRVGSMIQYLSSLGVLALATLWWLEREGPRARLFAPLLILFYCTPTQGSVMAAVEVALCCAIVLAGSSRRGAFWGEKALAAMARFFEPGRTLRIGAVAIVLIGVGVVMKKRFHDQQVTSGWAQEWTALGEWARANTPVESVFIVPYSNFNTKAREKTPWGPLEEAAYVSAPFEVAAHRQIYVDYKRGAAVMWSPSYYETWRRRFDEVSTLTSVEEKIAYAQRHGVNFVVALCGDADRPRAVTATNRLCAFKVPG